MNDPVAFRQESFVWNVRGGEVVLTEDGDAWRVSLNGEGTLTGPRRTIYTAKHDEAVMAAWDFMGRVKRFGNSSDGVVAGQQAARWMKSQMAGRSIRRH